MLSVMYLTAQTKDILVELCEASFPLGQISRDSRQGSNMAQGMEGDCNRKKNLFIMES
jgi:hypothetical protein